MNNGLPATDHHAHKQGYYHYDQWDESIEPVGKQTIPDQSRPHDILHSFCTGNILTSAEELQVLEQGNLRKESKVKYDAKMEHTEHVHVYGEYKLEYEGNCDTIFVQGR